MDFNQRREEYLSKATVAEQRAEKAQDSEARDGWLKIAEGYRDLARQTK